jgi:hypothetical protein
MRSPPARALLGRRVPHVPLALPPGLPRPSLIRPVPGPPGSAGRRSAPDAAPRLAWNLFWAAQQTAGRAGGCRRSPAAAARCALAGGALRHGTIGVRLPSSRLAGRALGGAAAAARLLPPAAAAAGALPPRAALAAARRLPLAPGDARVPAGAVAILPCWRLCCLGPGARAQRGAHQLQAPPACPTPRVDPQGRW